MDIAPLALLDFGQLTQAVTTPYLNLTLATVNDHVVKLSMMTQDFYWHYHPNSNETFIVTEGILLIDLETKTVELHPGQLFSIPQNVVHRTRPRGERSVNLTIEHRQIETVRVER